VKFPSKKAISLTKYGKKKTVMLLTLTVFLWLLRLQS